MTTTVGRRRFTTDQYHRMAETGILGEGDRVELVEGEVSDLGPITSRHAGTVARIAQLFGKHLRDRAIVWIQSPLAVAASHSELLPDVLLLAPRPDFYAGAFPAPPSVRLLVEVADASLSYDRQRKLPVYARACVAESWLVNADARRLEIHRTPGRLRYRSVRLPTPDETFAPAAFPDLKLRLRDLFG